MIGERLDPRFLGYGIIRTTVVRIFLWCHPRIAYELKGYSDALARCMKRHSDLQAELAALKKPDEERIRRVDCALARRVSQLIPENAKLRAGYEEIMKGTVNGTVGGEDVVWFDQIETLYDFCDRMAHGEL